jgi:hypothetical protein
MVVILLPCRITKIDFTGTGLNVYQLDAVSNMSQLTALMLRGTKLWVQSLPSSLGQLRQLVHLELAGDSPQAYTLPPAWGQLQKLEALYLWGIGITGQLPSSYRNMTALRQLHLEYSSMTTTLDDWWDFISRPGAPERQEVALVKMNLQGTVPAAFIDANRCACCKLEASVVARSCM